jgi:hypothetical protein
MFEDTEKREKKQQAQAYSAQIEGKLFEQPKRFYSCKTPWYLLTSEPVYTPDQT